MNEKHMTYAAIGMAVLAVLYAFRKPKQATAAAASHPVTDWAASWDSMMQGLSLERGAQEYQQQLSRLGGFSLSL